MLKHCGGSPKWLEAQSLQGTAHDGFAMPLDFSSTGILTAVDCLPYA